MYFDSSARWRINNPGLSDNRRALLGFLFGLAVMSAVVSVFQVNRFDFDNMARGVRLLLSGVDPWAPSTRIPHFYNPPFSVLFLWPMLFITPKIVLAIGGALLIAFAFHRRAWAGLAWFLTNSFLYLVAAGGIDMFVIGGGCLALDFGDRRFSTRTGLLLRALGYGLLLVKPQGGIFIVALYLLTRKDWRGVLLSALIYGLPFLALYPHWLHVILFDPPLAQTVASHTLAAKYGLGPALMVAALVVLRRPWTHWQLGAALAGLLSPYGVPGVPIFLVLCAVSDPAAGAALAIYSALLAAVTWVTPPDPAFGFYDYVLPLLSIYHLSMFGLALALACFVFPRPPGEIDAASRLRLLSQKVAAGLHAHITSRTPA